MAEIKKTNVLIVEDQKLTMASVASMIEASEDFVLAGTISNAANADLFCISRPVDLILMDVCTDHDENGIDACAVVKRHFPKIKVIIITSMAECSYLDRARAAGAESFWYKDAGSDLLDICRRTVAGESIYPERTPEVRLGMTTSYKLTPAELTALRAVMESGTYHEAAERVGCTERTIRAHMSSIMDKTGYRSRMDLLVAVASKKLIITDPDRDLDL